MMWLLAGTAAGLLLFGELEQIFNLINTLECRVEKGEAKGGIRRKKVAARLESLLLLSWWAIVVNWLLSF